MGGPLFGWRWCYNTPVKWPVNAFVHIFSRLLDSIRLDKHTQDNYGITMICISEMVEGIVKSGISEKELARLTGASQPTINRLRREVVVDPSYSLGKSIEMIYANTRKTRKKSAA